MVYIGFSITLNGFTIVSVPVCTDFPKCSKGRGCSCCGESMNASVGLSCCQPGFGGARVVVNYCMLVQVGAVASRASGVEAMSWPGSWQGQGHGEGV